MNKKAAWAHLRKLWKKMQQHFKEFTSSKSSEALHKFRVQVKKIRSFLTLLESNEANKQLLKKFKPIKRLFKSAGVIRDAMLHQQEAKAHHVAMPQFYKKQGKLQQGETNKVLAKEQKHLKQIRKVKRQLHKRLHAISADEIKTFFNNQLYNTQNILNKHDFSEQLHDGRKLLKHLMYNEHVVQDGLARDLRINFNYIDELQEVLGKWHDNKLSLEFFVRQKLDHAAINSIQQKNEELKKLIENKASDFAQKIRC